MSPDMPPPTAMLPWLTRMHASGIYVNNGPLVRELEQQLTDLVGLRTLAVSNGTLAIELALRALQLPAGSRVLVPGLTFSATGLAVQNAGLTPVVADVDPVTLHLTPWIARQHERIAAVVPVAAYGIPVDMSPWFAFAQALNIPVVVDAAGALCDQLTGESQLVHFAYSLHATKFIGCGEGGAVASSNKAILHRVDSLRAFGAGGTNAKMSEYHAGVGLAQLARRAGKLERLALVRATYQRGLAGNPGIVPIGPWPRHQTILCVGLIDRTADAVATVMALAGIQTRQWYRPMVAERIDISPASTLPAVDWARMRVLGLPFHHLLTPSDVDQVCLHLGLACDF